MLYELLFGGGNISIETMIQNDNSSVVERVHSISSVAKELRLNRFLESNRGARKQILGYPYLVLRGT